MAAMVQPILGYFGLQNLCKTVLDSSPESIHRSYSTSSFTKIKMSHQPKKYVPFAVTMITVIFPVTGTQSTWPGIVHALL